MMEAMADQWIIFSDLDGSLLDYKSYSLEPAKEALGVIRRAGIPLILCSSKTLTEMEIIREALGLLDPFVVENGGAIILPESYFPFPLKGSNVSGKVESLVLGRSVLELRRGLLEISEQTGVRVRGYGDLSDEEVSKLTGLTLESARRSRSREYDEPFMITGDSIQEEKLAAAAEKAGFRLSRGGRFFHLTGNHDKGKAVEILTQAYRKSRKNVVTAGIGDSFNDLSMLEAVDYPVLVQKPGGGYENGINLPGLIKADGVGPVGWNQAVLELIG